MSAITLITGLGIVGLLLIFLFFKLGQDDSKHYLLQIIFLGFIVMVMLLIGKTALDDKDFCSYLVANSTVDGSVTSYEYVRTCTVNDNTTAETFYKLTAWIMRITILYLFLYFSYTVFMNFKGGKS